MKTQDMKIRASALGSIMFFDNATQVTEKQLEKIEELELKKVTPAGISDKQTETVKKLQAQAKTETGISQTQQEELDKLIAKRDNPQGLTPNQQEELDTLIAKRDAPPALSKGAKTAVEKIFYEDKFEFRKNISSKYIQKGLLLEDKAIALVADFLGLPGIEKNETHYTNEFVQGTPDAIARLGFGEGFQFDIKNVYYPEGLDGFTNDLIPLYEWQGHAYNWMLGFEHGFCVKILQNLPAEMLQEEIRKLWKEAGRAWHEDIPQKFVDEVKDYFNFERLPLEDRIRIFKMTTTNETIQQMTDVVILAREHYATLPGLWDGRNLQNIEFIKNIVNG